MTSLKPPSLLESVAGSAATQGALTAVGVYAADVMQGGGPAIAALLPVLANTLAANRQSQRVQQAISNIDSTLRLHAEKLISLSDSQYKLINEVVAALFSTTCQSKLDILQRAIAGALKADTLPSHEAILLSRVLRDISFEEVDFLTKNFSFEFIELADIPGGYTGKVGTFSRSAPEGEYASGLAALGLLVPAENSFDRMGLLRFSPLCAKLLALLKAAP